MNRLTFLFIFLLLTTRVTAKVIVITHVIQGGNSTKHIIIGDNNSAINSEFKSNDFYKDALYVPKVLLKRVLVDNVENQILKSCKTLVHERDCYDCFSITIISNNGEKRTCFLETQQDSTDFFSSFRRMIAGSKSQKDYKKILRWISANEPK